MFTGSPHDGKRRLERCYHHFIKLPYSRQVCGLLEQRTGAIHHAFDCTHTLKDLLDSLEI